MFTKILNIASTLPTTTTSISSVIANKYKGDFRGLLKHLKVPDAHIEANIYVNDLTSSTDYEGINTDIKLINPTELAPYI